MPACLRAFPGIVLELSVDGVILESNGRLDGWLEQDTSGQPLAQFLDSSSLEKFARLLRQDRGTQSTAASWELVLERRDGLDLRTFVVVSIGSDAEARLWLIELPRSLTVEERVDELTAVSAELATMQRELTKERVRLERTLASEAQARRAAEQATQRIRALHAISSAALRAVTLDQIADQLLAELRSALGADTTTVLLLDEDARGLTVYASHGLGHSDSAGKTVRIPIGQGFAGQIALARHPVVLDDTSRTHVMVPQFRESLRSMMGAPLLAGDRLIGVLHVGSTAPRSFTPDEVEVLQVVADSVASAIERARLLELERAARAQAEAAVGQRDDVLAIVAHDLRNPVGGIQMAAEMLQEPTLPEAKRSKLLKVIARASDSMRQIIGDLLDVAAIEGGSLSLDARPLEPGPLLQEMREEFLQQAAESDLALECSLPERLPVVTADRWRVRQVFSNLIGNAIRLTPAGGRIVVAAEAPDGDAVRFSVSDTGPGISEQDLPHLFERYWQAKRSRRGAAGLGLAIAQGIVRAHGGRIWVESQLGIGSTFYFTLPTAKASQAE